MLRLIFAAVLTHAVQSLDIYVSPSGSDVSGNGSEQAPFQSPARAAIAVAAVPRPLTEGVVVHLAGGVYFLNDTLTLTPGTSGDSIFSVTWLGPSDPLQAAVLSAGQPLQGTSFAAIPGALTPSGSAVYAAQLPSQQQHKSKSAKGTVPFPWRLYAVNTSAAPAAAGVPVSTAAALRPLSTSPVQAYAAANTTTHTVTLQPGQVTADPTALQYAFITLWHSWATSINAVAGYDASSAVLTAVGQLGDPYNPLTNSLNRYTLSNIADVRTLTQPGTFLFSPDNGTVSYVPATDEPAPADWPADGSFYLVAEALQTAVHITQGVQNVRFVNITIAHAGADLHQQCLSGGCGAQGAEDAALAAAVAVDTGCSGVTFDTCTFTQSAGFGLRIEGGANDIIVADCVFEQLGAGGIIAGAPPATAAAAGAAAGIAIPTQRLTVTDSWFFDGGQLLPAAAAILLQFGNNCSISHNEIFGYHNTGIATGWSWSYDTTPNANIAITFNHIHHLGNDTSDFGCVYNLGVSPGTLIDHNLCEYVNGVTIGNGYYLDQASTGVTISNNVAHHVLGAGLHIHFGVNNTVVNNIFAVNDAYPCRPGVQCFDPASLLIDPGGAGQANSYSFHHNIVYLGADGSPNATFLLARTRYANESLNATVDYNCYWSALVANPAAALLWDNTTFSTWQHTPLTSGPGVYPDVHSLVADPAFAPSNVTGAIDYWHLQTDSPAITQTGFVPFDLSTVGPRPRK